MIIRECEQLDSVVVGKGSFTKHPTRESLARCKSLNNSKDVPIVDCGSLKEIMIGALSFSDYCNMFELKSMNVMLWNNDKDLPMLEKVVIGDENEVSMNFLFLHSFSIQSESDVAC